MTSNIGYNNVLLILAYLVTIVAGILGGTFIAVIVMISSMILSGKSFKFQYFLGLLILVFFLGDNFKGPLKFAESLRFAALAVGVLLYYIYPKVHIRLTFSILPFTIIATTVTLFNSYNDFEAILRGIGFFVVAVVVLNTVEAIRAESESKLYNVVLLTLSLYFVFNVLLLFNPMIFNTVLKGRFMGLMANPNGLGLVAMFSYGIVTIVSRKKYSTWGLGYLLIFRLLLVILMFLTGSRTAILGVVVFEYFRRSGPYIVVKGIFFLFLIYCINFVNIPEFLASIGLKDFIRLDTLSNASGRTEVWIVAIKEIQNNFWFGNGMLYDGYFIDEYAEKFLGNNRSRAWAGIWNSYLSIMLDTGFVGLLAFGYFFFKMFGKSQMKDMRTGFLAMLLSSGLTESWMAASMNAFTILSFIGWSLQMRNNNLNIKQ